MPEPVTAITAGAAVVGAGASIFAGNQASKAAKDAAKEQKKATKAAITAQEKALERQIGLQEPFRKFGVNAMPEYAKASEYAPFGINQFQADPGYQFRMSEGVKALERSAAARGILQSGQTLKDITRFGQDVASQEYQSAFQRYLAERQQRLQPLEYRIGIGQNAASNQGANIGSTAANVGNLTTSLGDIRSAGIMGQSNAYVNMLGNIAGLATQGANAYGQYQAAQPYQNYLRAIAPAAAANAPMNPTMIGGVY